MDLVLIKKSTSLVWFPIRLETEALLILAAAEYNLERSNISRIFLKLEKI